MGYCVPGAPPAPSGGPCHGTSEHGSQTSNAMALMLGAPPDAATRELVARHM
jgi:hypothetical protein